MVANKPSQVSLLKTTKGVKGNPYNAEIYNLGPSTPPKQNNNINPGIYPGSSLEPGYKFPYQNTVYITSPALDADYITAEPSPNLPNERVITEGLGIDLDDSGPNGSLTVNVIPNSHVQKVDILANGTLVGTRKAINFVNGDNIVITGISNISDDRIDLVITASGSSIVSQLTDLTDVTLTSVSSDQILVYNGSQWVNSSTIQNISIVNMNVDNGSFEELYAEDANIDNLIISQSLQMDPNSKLYLDQGSEALPGLSFRTDTNTGIFQSSPDSLSVSTGGREILNMSNSGLSFFNGSFSSSGDSRLGMYVLRNTTTSNSPTELFIDGISQRLILPTNTAWSFTITIVATNITNDESASYKYEGLIYKGLNNSSTVMVGDVFEIIIAESIAGWMSSVDADTTNGSLRIRVIGQAGKTIRWLAFANIMELKDN